MESYDDNMELLFGGKYSKPTIENTASPHKRRSSVVSG